MGDPDPFWLRYREEIKERVREVVVAGIGKLEAAAHLRKWARTEVTASNRARFIELVEEQLLV
ncbi:MAG: Fic family protein, partial [Verrucomicrobiales bacterium]